MAVSVVTKKQSSLLKKGKLKVKLDANRKRKVKLSAAHDGKGKFFEKDEGQAPARRPRNVSLKLTKKGKKKLAICGAKQVRVYAKYSSKGKKRTKSDSRVLKRDKSRCDEPVPAGTGRERRSLRLPRPRGLPAALAERLLHGGRRDDRYGPPPEPQSPVDAAEQRTASGFTAHRIRTAPTASAPATR